MGNHQTAGKDSPFHPQPSTEPSSESKILREMREQWNNRARENAFHYVASGKETWSEKEFFTSGEESVRELILDDLSRLTAGAPPKQLRILELGCGAGRMTRALSDVFGEVHAVDISPEMIKKAGRFLRGRSNVHLHLTTGFGLGNLPRGYFDLAFSFLVFQHVPDKNLISRSVAGVHDLLKPHGIFKFQAQGRWRSSNQPLDSWLGQHISALDAIRMARDCGFELLHSEGVGTQYFWLWYRKLEEKSASSPLRESEGRLLTEALQQIESELEIRDNHIETRDKRLEALRDHLRGIYQSPAYRLGWRLGLAPDPIREEELD